jgi:hypothetical protein
LKSIAIFLFETKIAAAELNDYSTAIKLLKSSKNCRNKKKNEDA